MWYSLFKSGAHDPDLYRKLKMIRINMSVVVLTTRILFLPQMICPKAKQAIKAKEVRSTIKAKEVRSTIKAKLARLPTCLNENLSLSNYCVCEKIVLDRTL